MSATETLAKFRLHQQFQGNPSRAKVTCSLPASSTSGVSCFTLYHGALQYVCCMHICKHVHFCILHYLTDVFRCIPSSRHISSAARPCYILYHAMFAMLSTVHKHAVLRDCMFSCALCADRQLILRRRVLGVS